ncbi:MAG: CvpA family protein [Rhizobiales bacterium]|nr:CvpA family protein [Hyphomicrobiales bacterium]
MPFQLLDLILFGIMLISGLLALMRGFTRELLSLIAWVLAAVAAYVAIRQKPIIDFAMQYFDRELFAQIAAGAGAFLIVLILVSLFSVKISDMVVDSAAGAFDRTLGFFYGLARGLVLVALAYLLYGWLTPPDKQEDWIRNARTLPMIQKVSAAIVSFVPADIAETLNNTALMRNPDASPLPQNTEPGQPESGYQTNETQGLDNLIQGTGQKPAFGQSEPQ